MILTDEMTSTFRMIEDTKQCLFITGKAGTGKTTFLRYIVENTHKKFAVTASTGIAAINAGGVTLHSLFGVPLEVLSPNAPMHGRLSTEKIQLYKELELLIIDEISMVRPDTLDYIDRKLRLCRMVDEPFGGVQVVMFGDLYQLPPVLKKDELLALQTFYRGTYFFYSAALRQVGFRIVELSHVFRQREQRFVDILNHIREYYLTPLDIEDLDVLRDRRKSQDYTNSSVHICATRKEVERINNEMLGEATHAFSASFSGRFNPNSAPCDRELRLRVGARVMLLVNDNRQGFCNGSMGIVTNITSAKIDVVLDNGAPVYVEPFTWTDREYRILNGEITAIDKGSCTQFPLTLGWAITIHKSQGLTFDNITIHLPFAFAPGQLYVALSRCTTMGGITTEYFIGPKQIKVDKELLAFHQAVKNCNNIFDRNTYVSLVKNYANIQSQA